MGSQIGESLPWHSRKVRWLKADGAEARLTSSNIEIPAVAYGDTLDPTFNPSGLLEDMTLYDWGDNFWPDWLFPSGMGSSKPAPPHLPLSNLIPADQGYNSIATSISDQEVGEAKRSRESLHRTVNSILPLSCMRPSKNPWPFENADDTGPLRTIPQLGAISRASDASYFHLPAMTDTTFSNILQAVKIPTIHSPWPALSLEGFPTNFQLDECMDLYFANFHPVSMSGTGLDQKRV